MSFQFDSLIALQLDEKFKKIAALNDNWIQFEVHKTTKLNRK